MKNTLPFGFIILFIIFLLSHLISALFENYTERITYVVVYILSTFIWAIMICLINYGILSLFKTKIDWTLINNIKVTVLDLFMFFIINGLLNVLNKQSIFSFQGINLSLAAAVALILLCWRIVALFLT